MKSAEVDARPPRPSDPTIDGLAPQMVFEPASAEAAAQALDLCAQEKLAVVPVGAGTRLHVGNVPTRLDCYLSTLGLTGVTDYEPGDLTLSALAGTPLARVQAATGAEGQFLPWDPPQARVATVGGILASGDPGFRKRPGARPRDVLLGFEALLPDGTAVKAGGRVVKNVAGFEVAKLLVGSLGTLAVFTKVHLRVRLRPERALTLVASCETQEQARDAVLGLRRAAIDPEVLAVTNPTLSLALGISGWSLVLRLEGFEEEVGALSARAREHLPGASCFEPREAESDVLWEGLRDLPAPIPPELIVGAPPPTAGGLRAPPAGAILRVHARSTSILALPVSAEDQVAFFPDGGLGYIRSPEPERFRQLATVARVVLESGPSSLKREVEVFGENSPEPSATGVGPRRLKEDSPERDKALELMQRVKKAFDPTGILSPGRALGKI